MKALELNRSFLRRPLSGVTILFIIVLLYELLSWTLNPSLQSKSVNYANGLLGYMLNWVFGFYIPEFVSLYIIVSLNRKFHNVFKINEVELNSKSILLYEFKFLPLFLTAYFFFIPITLHLRFLIREFPSFDVERYESVYLRMLYTSMAISPTPPSSSSWATCSSTPRSSSTSCKI